MTTEGTFSDLTVTQKNTLISGCNSFQKVLKDVFGDVEGSRVWGEVADNVMIGLKKEVLANCLTNKYGNTVTVKSVTPYNYTNTSTNPNRRSYNKVAAIKAIRVATGLGLKDSKDVCDNAERGIQTVLKIGTSNKYDQQWNIIDSYDVSETRMNLIAALQQEGFEVY